MPKSRHPSTRRFPALAPVLAPVLLLSLAALHPLRASINSLVWATPTAISADTNVSTTGTLNYAYSFGDVGTPSTTVNGVTFVSFPVPNNSSSTVTVGSVSLGLNSGNGFFSDNSAAGSGVSPFSNLSTSYQTLLQSAVTFDTVSGNLNLTLGGLTFQNKYLVEFWSNSSTSSVSSLAGQTNYKQGSISINVDDNTTDATGGVGQWVTATFTATSTTEVFTITSSNPSADFPVLNALELRNITAVPEPGATALGVASLLGVVIFFRRTRQHGL